MLEAEPQFGGVEETVDDIVAALQPVVDEAGRPLRVDQEERRGLARVEAGREFDVRLAPVVEGSKRPPCRLSAGDRIVEMKLVELQTAGDRLDAAGLVGGRLERDELVLGIGLSCPRLSGPSTMIVWTAKGTTNAEQEAQAGRDHREAT